MGRKSNICQAIWEAEWEATRNKIPADVRALTLGATSVNRWFELLCESEYTTTSECARLRAGVAAAEGIGRHHSKHRESPNEQTSVVKQVLRDVARSMSARFPKSKDEATKPDRKHKSIQVPAKPVLSDTMVPKTRHLRSRHTSSALKNLSQLLHQSTCPVSM